MGLNPNNFNDFQIFGWFASQFTASTITQLLRILKYINIKDNVILLDKITSTYREIISNGFALSMTKKPRISRLLTKWDLPSAVRWRLHLPSFDLMFRVQSRNTIWCRIKFCVEWNISIYIYICYLRFRQLI